MFGRGLVAFFSLIPWAFCQQAGPATGATGDGQAISALNAISQHMARLEPMLEQVRVKEWVAKGAPDSYVQQLASINREIQGIEDEMARVAQHTDKLQDVMRAVFRVQAFHVPLNSLMGGLRRYQNPALADLIDSVASEDQVQIVRLEQYVLQLADAKDQQYGIVDKEAQRCRAMLSVQPPLRGTAHAQ